SSSPLATRSTWPSSPDPQAQRAALFVVAVKPPPALAAQTSALDHALLDRMRPVARLLEVSFIHGARHIIVDVAADQVNQLEWAHAKADGAHQPVNGRHVGRPFPK